MEMEKKHMESGKNGKKSLKNMEMEKLKYGNGKIEKLRKKIKKNGGNGKKKFEKIIEEKIFFSRKKIILQNILCQNKLFYGIFTIIVTTRFIFKNFKKVGKVSKIDDSCFK